MSRDGFPAPDPSSGANKYGTPRWLTRRIAGTLPTQGEKFTLDPATGDHHETHAWRDIGPAENGLTTPWEGWVWCNPPWSSKANDGRMKEAWARRAAGQERRGEVEAVFLLLPTDPSTTWFRSYGTQADLVTFLGRIQFDGMDGRNPAFGSMILTYGAVPEATESVLADCGPTYSGPPLRGDQTTLSGLEPHGEEQP